MSNHRDISSVLRMLTSWEQHGLVLLALVCCLCGAVPGRALPALTLAKSALPSVVRPGDMITYTLVYRNTGPTTATGVVLTDPLPAHLTYVLGSANNTPTYNPVTRVLSWALGAMPPSGPTTSAQVTFKALVDTSAPLGQSLANTATIACNEVTTPVTGTTTTLVSAPALTLVKSASAATVQAGGAVTFTLSYANIGSGYATNVVLTDQLPRGLTLVPPSTTGVYNTATRLLTWKLGALNAAATGSVSFLATVDADTAVGAQLTNTAGILCSEVTNAVTSNVTITVILGGGHGDWWMFHHDVKHTGRSPYLGPSYATKKWAFPAGIIAYSSPALGADGAVYIGSDNANLYAINPDGTQRWAFPTGYFIRASPPLDRMGPSISARSIITSTRSIRTVPSAGRLIPMARPMNRRRSLARTGRFMSGRPISICMPSIRTAPKNGPLPPLMSRSVPRPSGRMGPSTSVRWIKISMRLTRTAPRNGS